MANRLSKTKPDMLLKDLYCFVFYNVKLFLIICCSVWSAKSQLLLLKWKDYNKHIRPRVRVVYILSLVSCDEICLYPPYLYILMTGSGQRI
ncbi:hypothetical protein V1509DRAFT_451670 [Lipomyces kononenkoae]